MTSWPLATLTLTVFGDCWRRAVSACGHRKWFVVPESAIADRVLLTGGELQDVDE